MEETIFSAIIKFLESEGTVADIEEAKNYLSIDHIDRLIKFKTTGINNTQIITYMGDYIKNDLSGSTFGDNASIFQGKTISGVIIRNKSDKVEESGLNPELLASLFQKAVEDATKTAGDDQDEKEIIAKRFVQLEKKIVETDKPGIEATWKKIQSLIPSSDKIKSIVELGKYVAIGLGIVL